MEPFGARVFRFFLVALVLSASLVGNAVVVHTAITARQQTKVFLYFLVANLSIAELINTCTIPFLVVYDELGTWYFGEFLCHIVSPLQVTALLVTTSTIAAIAMYRCWFLAFPMIAQRLPSSRRLALLVITFIWFASIVLVLPNFIYNTEVQGPHGHVWCLTLFTGDTIDTFPSTGLQVLSFLRIAINFVVAVVLVTASYLIVLYKVRALGKRSRVYEHNSKGASQTERNVEGFELGNMCHVNPAFCADHDEQRSYENTQSSEQQTILNVTTFEADIFNLFYAIVLIFIIGYYPYQIFYILEYTGKISIHWRYLKITRKYLLLLAFFPSALHPICYGTMSNFYYKAFTKFILCRN
ncbi:predicted protein [Nematostella vectensis]|nr:predicted protein [Nematostella vectensis]|eukprot:XP_001619553.1 hypothetical protein NEMVEDRAFT_v1g224071 [Nematostella vectensis]